MKRAIVWFRRDLRIADNTAFLAAIREAEEIIPLFLFDDYILENLPPDDLRLSFLTNVLVTLRTDLQSIGGNLFVFRGKPEELIPKITEICSAEAVFLNRAVSRYGKKRDARIQKILSEKGISFLESQDTFSVDEALLPPRKVFSAFWRKWKEVPKIAPVSAPEFCKIPAVSFSPLHDIAETLIAKEHPLWNSRRLHIFPHDFSLEHYSETRNFPALEDGTSRLSPFLRFGILSVRQIWNALQQYKHAPESQEAFAKELCWREFWFHIAQHFPESLEHEFQEKRRNIAWQKNDELLNAWKTGNTGYPLVDAGMRQLQHEGWMHGRVRMVVSSFLTKDLLLDWREGERHFANCLFDYEEAVNVGNWQWSASVGADPKPMRIFNPMLQSKRFDPEAVYIRRYLPELTNVPLKHIHNPVQYALPLASPIVFHAEQVSKAKRMYGQRAKR